MPLFDSSLCFSVQMLLYSFEMLWNPDDIHKEEFELLITRKLFGVSITCNFLIFVARLNIETLPLKDVKSRSIGRWTRLQIPKSGYSNYQEVKTFVFSWFSSPLAQNIVKNFNVLISISVQFQIFRQFIGFHNCITWKMPTDMGGLKTLFDAITSSSAIANYHKRWNYAFIFKTSFHSSMIARWLTSCSTFLLFSTFCIYLSSLLS